MLYELSQKHKEKFCHIVLQINSYYTHQRIKFKNMYHHLSPYNYKQYSHFLKDALDSGRNQNKPTDVANQFFNFKFFHQKCVWVIFHTNTSSHLLLQSVFMLRKLQLYAAQLHGLKNSIDTQADKLKISALMERVGIFAKDRLSQEDKEHFLRYRTIQCSKFSIPPLDQGSADLLKLKEWLINMEITSKLVNQYCLQALRTIRTIKNIMKAISDSRTSVYGQEFEKQALIEKIKDFYKASFAVVPQFYEAKWEEIYGKTKIYEAYIKSSKNMEKIA